MILTKKGFSAGLLLAARMVQSGKRLFVIQRHPCLSSRSNIEHNFRSRIRVTGFSCFCAHALHQFRITQPGGNFFSNLDWVVRKVTKSPFQDKINISSFLAWQKRSQHDWQSNSRSFGNSSWSSLGHQDISRNHIFGHSGNKPQTYHIDISLPMVTISHILTMIESVLHRSTTSMAEASENTFLLWPVFASKDSIPISLSQFIFELVITPAYDTDCCINAITYQSGVNLVGDC
mmetsp:Transcript_14412/g.29824  ORF Transcript_14412/g.29824 Transcript_14412/m.29824 type:complete len:233 (+) Transcript_14412:64-762(+)